MTTKKIIIARILFTLLLLFFLISFKLNLILSLTTWFFSGWITFQLYSRHKIRKWDSSSRFLQMIVITFGLIGLGGIAFICSLERAESLEKLNIID